MMIHSKALVLYLVALAFAEGVESVDKEMCTSLLQIGSVVTGHSAREAFEDVMEEAKIIRQHKPLTLLQVSAKTGGVSQYQPSQEDDDAEAPVTSTPERAAHKADHTAMTPDRRNGIAAMLSTASHAEASAASPDKHGDDDDKNQADEEEKPKKTDEEPKSKVSDKTDEEPESKVLQGARIAPFGKEDTSRELQHHAARTQDTLVDAIENAEVAEIKRSIFRSLTRLRAAEIKEFDTIARLETQAIDEYNDNHHYRKENPLDYIHGAEVPVKEDKYTSFHD